MRLPRPTSATLPVHFFWLFAAAVFLFAGVVWSGQKAHAEQLSPSAAAQGRRQRATKPIASSARPAPARGDRVTPRRAGPDCRTPTRAVAVSADASEVALARYTTAVGADSIEQLVLQSSSSLAQRVLADTRIDLTAAGRADVASGRVDPRILAVLLYLAEAHGQVGVSCLITGHSRFVAQTKAEKKAKEPRHVSAHISGHAVDISSLGGTPILGNQQPGGVTDRAIEEILSLPGVLQPRQVISLLDLSGPVLPAAGSLRPPSCRVLAPPLGSRRGSRPEGRRNSRLRKLRRRRFRVAPRKRPARPIVAPRRRGHPAPARLVDPHVLHALPDRCCVPRQGASRASHRRRVEAVADGVEARRQGSARAARRALRARGRVRGRPPRARVDLLVATKRERPLTRP